MCFDKTHKRNLTVIIAFIFPLLLFAQSQYDYYDDSAVAGGAERALNGIIWIALIIFAAIVIVFVLNWLLKIYYWFNPVKNPENKRKKLEQDSVQKRNDSSRDEIEETQYKSDSHIEPFLSLEEVESLIVASSEEEANKKLNECDHKFIAYYSSDYKKFISLDFRFERGCSLVISDGTETICSDAINSSTLTKISLPQTIKYIGERAFNCRLLTEITLPDSLRYIGKYALWSCESIQEITIPHNVSFIGELALPYKCMKRIINKSPYFKIEENGLYTADKKRLIKYFGDDIEISIPNGVNNISGAFAGCTKLEKVILPNSLYVIGKRAFHDCKNLKEIILPDNLVEIQYDAFYNCKSIESIILPEGLKSIGDGCFYGCSNLRYVQMPSSLEIEVDDNPKLRIQLFGNCASLKYVFISSGMKTYFSSFIEQKLLIESTPEEYFNKKNTEEKDEKSDTSLKTEVTEEEKTNGWSDEFDVRYSEDRKRLLYSTKRLGSYVYPSSIVEYEVKESVTTICNEAFSSGNLNSIKLPHSLEIIGEGVFSGCRYLANINIPDSVNIIGDYVFQSCALLKTIHLPQNLKRISRSMFYGCSSLSEITIPDTVERIEDNSFFHCEMLKDICIPENVKYIGNNAFGACDGIKRVIIPKSVKEINGNPFTATILSGKHYVVESKSPYYIVEKGGLYSSDRRTLVACLSNDSIFEVVEGTISIGRCAFSYSSKLQNIILPPTLERIEEDAFESCGFTRIQIPDTVKYIGDGAFNRCNNLSRIILPEKLDYLGEKVFEECKSLSEIVLPKSIESIGRETFMYCDILNNVRVPEGVRIIKKDAFYLCKNLTDICFPNSLEKIENGAFISCGLKTVYLPKQTIVAEYAFANECTILRRT